MAEQISERPTPERAGAMCIHTNRITDGCLDKDCVEDLRVYLTEDAQALLDRSAGARARSAELLTAAIDVEELGFQRGFYSVDLTFYYRVRGDVSAGGVRAGELDGLAVFSKRVVLFGGESGTKIFSSTGPALAVPGTEQPPEAIVEVIDPMVLSTRVLEGGGDTPQELVEIPEQIRDLFPQPLVTEGDGRRLLVTVGQFSTIRLEREAQLTLSGTRYCVPQKSCCDEGACQEDPCDVFSRIEFPYGTFYPRGAGCECVEAAQE